MYEYNTARPPQQRTTSNPGLAVPNKDPYSTRTLLSPVRVSLVEPLLCLLVASKLIATVCAVCKAHHAHVHVSCISASALLYTVDIDAGTDIRVFVLHVHVRTQKVANLLTPLD